MISRAGAARLFAALSTIIAAAVVCLLLRETKWLPAPPTLQAATEPHSSGTSPGGDPPKNGYLVVLEYNGQQGAGIRAIVSLQCFVGSFDLPLYILEPVLDTTKFISTNRVGNGSIKFRELFDFKHFNSASSELNFGTMVLQEDFVQNAPTRVVYVRFSKSYTEQNVVWLQSDSKHCYKLAKKEIYTKISALFQKEICIVGYINSPEPPTEQVFNTIFTKWRPENITLVVSKWMGIWAVQNKSTQRTNHICTYARLKSVRVQFSPSAKLMSDAKRYKEEFLKSSNLKTVAVMFRFEHLIQEHSKCNLKSPMATKKCTNACLNDAVTIVKKTIQKPNFSTIPFASVDIGQYGSATIENFATRAGVSISYLQNQAEFLISTLYNNTLTFEQWERNYTAITTHPGYMAALQRTVASEADCLVLVGGGNFQEITLHDFKHSTGGSKDCYHLVCPEQRIKSVADHL